MLSRSLAVSLVLVLSLVSTVVVAWPPQSNGGWEDVTSQIFPPHVNPVRPSALVDWNGDQFIDMVVIGNGVGSGQSNVFAVYEWQEGNHSFALAYQSPPLMVVGSNAVADSISNVVVADFNRNGRNDVVVLTASGALWALHASTQSITRVNASMLPPTADGGISGAMPQLSAANVFGRCALPDLVLTTTTGSLYVLRNTLGDNAATCDFVGGEDFSFEPTLIDQNVEAMSVLTADVSGTCNAQLLYGVGVTSGLVTYRMYDSGAKTSSDLFSVPDYAGIPIALDVNADGATDFAFPYCTSTDTACRSGLSGYSALLFVENAVGGATCGQYDCCAGFVSSFVNVPVDSDKGTGFSVVSLSSLSGGSCPGLTNFPRTLSTNGPLSMPQVVRNGDYNRDSFTDLLSASNVGPAILTRTNGGDMPPLFDCTIVASSAATEVMSRLIPFYFDIEEDGRLDMILVDTQPTTNDGIGLYSVWNGLSMHEDYFLTAVVLNGVNVNAATVANPAPANVGFPAQAATQLGAVHRFQWQDINTNLRTQEFTQQGASQAHSLQNPRVHFGLGRTFSYIQNYASGIHYSAAAPGASSSSTALSFTWSSSYLIPNSQVVVIPYPLTNPSAWLIKLFLSSSKYQTLLIIALSTALAVIGVPIIILKYREMQEDNAEMKKHA
jgi:integrin alpha FG-GAP repeat containing protein 1